MYCASERKLPFWCPTHSQYILEIEDLKFDSESAYISNFTFGLVSTDITSMEVTEDMIGNVCMSIPHDSTYAIMDMKWKELDRNLKFVYGYK